jgi:ATP phosphoribosyltransferase regulatory subunit
VFVPLGVPQADTAALRARGFATVAALDTVSDAAAEALRLGCTHVLHAGEAVALGDA